MTGRSQIIAEPAWAKGLESDALQKAAIESIRQPHFFPIIMDGKMLYEVMLQRLPASANDKPSPSAWSLDLALEQTSIGRQIKENLSEEQLKQVKEMKGFPGLDDK